jgi:hypothetical protein
MKLDKFDKYDLLTRHRAVFVMTLGFLQQGLEEMNLEESFFTNLHEFGRIKINEDKNKYFPLFLMILPSIKKGTQLSFYESEKTVKNLYEILDEIKSLDDYIALLDNCGGEYFVDKLSMLATEFLEYMNEFDKYYEPTLLPN